MIHAKNADRAAIAAWLKDAFSDPDILIGEGSFIEVYDDDAAANSPQSDSEHAHIRRLAFDNIRRKADGNFVIARRRMSEWLATMSEGRVLDSLGMKCGMDKQDTLTVDLAGNIVTCQNASSVSFAPNGAPHLSGHLDDIAGAVIRTSTHFSNRAGCQDCPVVQVCKGGCMYLDGDLFVRSCENAYTDHVPYFAAAVEKLTGYELLYIEDEGGRLPESRRDVFGLNACDAPDQAVLCNGRLRVVRQSP